MLTEADDMAELGVLRSAQDRVLEREGIPMLLALVSEVGEMPAVDAPAARAEGAALAGEMDRFRQALTPTARDNDMGCLTSVMQAVAYRDFGAPPERLPEPAQAVVRQEIGQEGS